MKSWVEVSAERLRANFAVLAAAAGDRLVLWPDGGNYPEVTLLAVIKANAYGHGAGLCAGALRGAGAEWLGVTDVAEGIIAVEGARRWRPGFFDRGSEIAFIPRIGPPPKVLVMCGFLQEDAAKIVRHGLVPVLWRVEHLRWLVQAIGRKGLRKPLPVHVEIDTGMSRQGCRPGEETDEILEFLRSSAGQALRLEGVFTHFASSEVVGAEETRRQEKRFERTLAQVTAAGLRPAWIHAGNSSTVDEGSSLDWLKRIAREAGARAMVRTGLGLYGYCLPLESGTAGGSASGARVQAELQPVMCWKARVIDVRELEAGAAVGYNGTFVAERPMRLAVLPVGYADGLRRELSSVSNKAGQPDCVGGGWVMFAGRRAPIVGRVSMNLTVVDISLIDGIKVGDEAILLGDGFTAEDHARLARTIAYEICCEVNSQLERVLLDERKPDRAVRP